MSRRFVSSRGAIVRPLDLWLLGHREADQESDAKNGAQVRYRRKGRTIARSGFRRFEFRSSRNPAAPPATTARFLAVTRSRQCRTAAMNQNLKRRPTGPILDTMRFETL
jgi:hypothetical protein